MTRTDNRLLSDFRDRRPCEWCRQRVSDSVHHLWCRGMGGGSRLDVRINLISLCCWCHHDAQHGIIQRFDLLAIVAKRERTTQDRIERTIYALLRAPKGSDLDELLQTTLRG
jgi:hypothetical protein